MPHPSPPSSATPPLPPLSHLPEWGPVSIVVICNQLLIPAVNTFSVSVSVLESKSECDSTTRDGLEPLCQPAAWPSLSLTAKLPWPSLGVSRPWPLQPCWRPSQTSPWVGAAPWKASAQPMLLPLLAMLLPLLARQARSRRSILLGGPIACNFTLIQLMFEASSC